MQCLSFVDLLAIPEGMRSAEEKSSLDRHRGICDACQRLDEKFRESLAIATAMPLAPAGSLDKFLAQLPVEVVKPIFPSSAAVDRFSLLRWLKDSMWPLALGAGMAAALFLLVPRISLEAIWGVAPVRQSRGDGVTDVERWVEIKSSLMLPGQSPQKLRTGGKLKPGMGIFFHLDVPTTGHVALYEQDPSGHFTPLGRWHQKDKAGGSVGPSDDGHDVYFLGADPGKYAFIALYSAEPIPKEAEVRIDLEGRRSDGFFTLGDHPEQPIFFDTLEVTLLPEDITHEKQ